MTSVHSTQLNIHILDNKQYLSHIFTINLEVVRDFQMVVGLTQDYQDEYNKY